MLFEGPLNVAQVLSCIKVTWGCFRLGGALVDAEDFLQWQFNLEKVVDIDVAVVECELTAV